MESSLLSALQGRSGPLFWVSAIAVAAGVTALAVSLLLVGARLARARRRRPAAAAAAPVGSPVAAASRAAPTGPAAPPSAAVLRAYQAQSGGENAPREPEFPPPQTTVGVEPGQGGSVVRLAPLLTRLRSAANRLEEIALTLEPPATGEAGNSGLKTGPDDVEYLFRTGV